MKKILFVCGSLAPGRDGVGDYTRRLAAEMMNHDFIPMIIATHDRDAATVLSEKQAERGTEIETVRIPRITSSGERLSLLQHELRNFGPDWLSLQYVPHSFDKRGIPFRFIQTLKKLNWAGDTHIMYHELWTTYESLRKPKNLVISQLEKVAVARLSRTLKPLVCHTQLPLYQQRLKRLGINASPLPLYANVARGVETEETKTKRDNIFRAAFFSQMILPEAVIKFLRELHKDISLTTEKNLIISLLGGGKEKVTNTAAALAKALPGVTIEPIGFLPTEELSRRLNDCDLGITPVKLHQLGKSATVATFINHHLPVAAPYVVMEGRSFFLPALNNAVFSTYSPEAFKKAEKAAKTLDTSIISVGAICQTFVKDLSKKVPAKAIS